MKKRNPWGWVPTLYFAEGLPYVAIMTLSLVLYKQLGLSNAEITLYTSWLYLPWVIKPLWSPFLDLLKTKRWWIAAMELLIGAAFGGVAFTLPTSFWLQGTLFFFWVMAFSSASHDFSTAEFYTSALDQNQQSEFVGIRSMLYRLSTIFGQGILVMIAGNLQVLYRNNISYSWSLMFYGVAGLFIAFWLWHSYILPRPGKDVECDSSIQDMFDDIIETVKAFFRNCPLREILIGISFMLLYRLPEGLLSKVSSLFLIDAPHNGGLGLSPQEYGLVQGTVGVIGLSIGGVLGSIAIGKGGLKKWLWPMALAITLPNIVYIYMSFVLPSSLVVISMCVFLEQFGYGFGFTAYLFYLFYYSQGALGKTNYAMCTTFMALSMMLPGLFAGALQQFVGYRIFFIIVMITCFLTFIVSALITVDSEFGKK